MGVCMRVCAMCSIAKSRLTLCDPMVKNLPANAGDTGLIPGSERSPREGNDNPLQYSCLVNPMAREAWQATVYGVIKESDRQKSWTKHTHTHIFFGASQVALVVENLPANAGGIRDGSSIPGSGRSPGGGNATHSTILA